MFIRKEGKIICPKREKQVISEGNKGYFCEARNGGNDAKEQGADRQLGGCHMDYHMIAIFRGKIR